MLRMLIQKINFLSMLHSRKEWEGVRLDVKLNCITLGNPGCNWTICPKYLSPNDIVYSFGVGTDISFDVSLIKRYSVKIYAFDPTTRSCKWITNQVLPENFKHYKFALSNSDGELILTPPKNNNHVSYRIANPTDHKKESFPAKKLSSLMKMHNHKHISILKLDIEGSEIPVIKNIIQENISIDQLLVEFHHRFEKNGVEKVRKSIRMLKYAGYKLFYISNSGEEFSFINRRLLKGYRK